MRHHVLVTYCLLVEQEFCLDCVIGSKSAWMHACLVWQLELSASATSCSSAMHLWTRQWKTEYSPQIDSTSLGVVMWILTWKSFVCRKFWGEKLPEKSLMGLPSLRRQSSWNRESAVPKRWPKPFAWSRNQNGIETSLGFASAQHQDGCICTATCICLLILDTCQGPESTWACCYA